MAGFADLPGQCRPTYATYREEGTVGRTWAYPWGDIDDDEGDPIDLTGITALCEIVDRASGAVLLTLPVDLGVGTFTVRASAALSATIAPGAYRWRLKFTSGAVEVQMWGGIESLSTFTVRPA